MAIFQINFNNSEVAISFNYNNSELQTVQQLDHFNITSVRENCAAYDLRVGAFYKILELLILIGSRDTEVSDGF